MSTQHTPEVIAAARALCKRNAEVCNVDADDSWAIYGEEFIADAIAALQAADPEIAILRTESASDRDVCIKACNDLAETAAERDRLREQVILLSASLKRADAVNADLVAALQRGVDISNGRTHGKNASDETIARQFIAWIKQAEHAITRAKA